MTTQGIPPEQEPIILSRACPPNCRGIIPPETIKVGVNHEGKPNPMKEYYIQGVFYGYALAVSEVEDILENAEIAERKRIGAWLDSHACGVIRPDGMPSGMAFADIVTDLKAGKLPGGA